MGMLAGMTSMTGGGSPSKSNNNSLFGQIAQGKSASTPESKSNLIDAGSSMGGFGGLMTSVVGAMANNDGKSVNLMDKAGSLSGMGGFMGNVISQDNQISEGLSLSNPAEVSKLNNTSSMNKDAYSSNLSGSNDLARFGRQVN